MTVHFHREMDLIKSQILGLGTMVEEQVYYAVKAVEELDEQLAQEVIAQDRRVDLKEIEIEEECLKAMALHQPVAIDLRLLITVLKINNDLERIGDMAVNIAKTVSYIKTVTGEKPLWFDAFAMAGKTRVMFKKSLDALVNLDENLANVVLASDDEVDAMHRDLMVRIEKLAPQSPEKIGLFLRYVLISRNLERIADHATNIAEDVLYMIRGRIQRHGKA